MGIRSNSLLRKLRKQAHYYSLSVDNQRLILRFLIVCGFILILLFFSALLVWLFEYKGNSSSTITSFWDGIWWAVVTIATVGYGDKFPITQPGRMVGLILIIIGFATLSIFTGLIASLFLEDKLKGAKGLKQKRLHNHIVVCNWNNTAHFFLRALIDKNMQSNVICLLMNEAPEFFEAIESQYLSLSLSFVRGEASSEAALRRASVSTAKQVIILADHNLDAGIADDRSIIVANSTHYLVKSDKITVQLLNDENKQMLQRLGITKTLVWDDIGGYMLANNVADQNNLNIFTQLVKSPEPSISTCEISSEFYNKSYGELYDHIYATEGHILMGLMTREPELEIDSIFDDDSSAIDQFIKSTLSKSHKLFSEDKKNIRINPSRDEIIQDNDYAIILL